MKHITITGPHGSGKDSVIKKLVPMLEAKHPGKTKRVLFVTTRPPRPGEVPGEDAIYISEPEFLRRRENREVLYWIRLPGYFVGTDWSQLEEYKILLHNIVLEGAKILEKTGPVFKIAINAPLKDRKRRVLARDASLKDHEAEFKLLNDPRLGIEDDYPQYDLVVENPDGVFDQTVEKIYDAVENFISKS